MIVLIAVSKDQHWKACRTLQELTWELRGGAVDLQVSVCAELSLGILGVKFRLALPCLPTSSTSGLCAAHAEIGAKKKSQLVPEIALTVSSVA
jgi:hypothetical protein